MSDAHLVGRALVDGPAVDTMVGTTAAPVSVSNDAVPAGSGTDPVAGSLSIALDFGAPLIDTDFLLLQSANDLQIDFIGANFTAAAGDGFAAA
jgi:hypothetical protein